jgi:tetraacyldisaccharide 4'-kinase
LGVNSQKLQLIIRFFSLALYPLSLLYACIIYLRNWAFDHGILPSKTPAIYTICVGNITVGGTGKTPMVAFLAENLSKNFNVALLSRGYGRSTKGFRQVTSSQTAQTVGDEPYLYFLRFGSNIPVFVGEDRLAAYQKIQALNPNIQVLILDDAYQHRYINAHHKLLMLDFNRLPFNDYHLPFGRLREGLYSIKRAHSLVISKCPEKLNPTEKTTIENNCQAYTTKKPPIYFSNISYQKPVGFNGEGTINTNNYLIVSSIAQHTTFEFYCKSNFNVAKAIHYPDHHLFAAKDLQHISTICQQHNLSLLCTEKDYVKLKGLLPKYITAFYLPISMQFNPDQNILLSYFNSQIKQFQQTASKIS